MKQKKTGNYDAEPQAAEIGNSLQPVGPHLSRGIADAFELKVAVAVDNEIGELAGKQDQVVLTEHKDAGGVAHDVCLDLRARFTSDRRVDQRTQPIQPGVDLGAPELPEVGHGPLLGMEMHQQDQVR